MSLPEYDPTIDPPVRADIVRLASQELAPYALETIADVLEVDVTVGALVQLSDNSEPPEVRLAAKRALRCIEGFGRPDSPVLRRIGAVGMYSYVEAVVEYGASEMTYLTLMEVCNLSPAETTALYALREAIAEETNGTRPGFPTILRALAKVGISAAGAAGDTDAALAALAEAGCFIDHMGSATYSRPLFAPQYADNPPTLGYDVDSTPGTEAKRWLRSRFGPILARQKKEMEE